MTIELHGFHTMQGHATLNIIEDSDPEERKELASIVIELIRKGHAVFVRTEGGEEYRVRGYDAINNEWIVIDPNAGKAEEEPPAPKKKRGRPPKKPAATSAVDDSAAAKQKAGGKRGRPRTQKVPASGSTATNVPQKAGG